ncbi:MAG TPA: hypothetical protein VE988_27705, partial [Gemmataceae bacterium]|nr:hypothetical protein [Gemmataceae bacterium]
GRVLSEAKSDQGLLVERIYQVALGRLPTAKEAQLSKEFLVSEAKQLRERLGRGEKVLTPTGASEGIDPAFSAAVVDLCHVVLNLNEFAYVD